MLETVRIRQSGYSCKYSFQVRRSTFNLCSPVLYHHCRIHSCAASAYRHPCFYALDCVCEFKTNTGKWILWLLALRHRIVLCCANGPQLCYSNPEPELLAPLQGAGQHNDFVICPWALFFIKHMCSYMQVLKMKTVTSVGGWNKYMQALLTYRGVEPTFPKVKFIVHWIVLNFWNKVCVSNVVMP